MESIQAFFTRITGLTPTPDQEKYLRNLSNISIKFQAVTAGRQTGKSLASIVGVLYYAYIYPKPVHILIASIQDTVLTDHIKTIFRKNPKMQEKITQPGMHGAPIPLYGFDLGDGNIVYIRKATPAQCEGLTADIVIADEAGKMSKSVIEDLMGNLSGPISKFVMISTAKPSNSFFVEVVLNPKKHGFVLDSWSAVGCSWHDPKLLKYKKKNYSKQRYAVDVLGRPPKKSEINIFRREWIAKCIREEVMTEGGKRFAGIDSSGFGSVGENVITIVEKVPGVRRKVLLQVSYGKAQFQDCYQKMIAFCKMFEVEIIKIDSKPKDCADLLEDSTKIPVVRLDMAFVKRKALGQLKNRIKNGHLEIPKEYVKLKLQLERYKPKKRSHDDLVDSLMYAHFEDKWNLKFKPTAIYEPFN